MRVMEKCGQRGLSSGMCFIRGGFFNNIKERNILHAAFFRFHYTDISRSKVFRILINLI